MAEDDDSSQKTEEPTEKRLKDAQEKGQVINSRELTNFLLFLGMTLLVIAFIPNISGKFIKFGYQFFSNIEDIKIDQFTVIAIFKKIIIFILIVMLVPFFLTLSISILSSFLQTGIFNISTAPLMPDFSRISIMSGFKRLFSFRSVFELIKGVVKLIIVAASLYFAIKPEINSIVNVYSFEVRDIALLFLKLTKNMFIVTSIILLLIGAADYIFQRLEYFKSLRMSKEEIKQEYKQQEGSPEIKAKLRQIRASRIRRRMMEAVPKSDVIITNPTHYSIALQYDAQKSSAPIVVAKGLDLIALKIREVAKENDIPIVENPPLARGLYDSTDIGKEVPLEHYKAVAEIINYVYRLKKKS